jgi:hypothetical protein
MFIFLSQRLPSAAPPQSASKKEHGYSASVWMGLLTPI